MKKREISLGLKIISSILSFIIISGTVGYFYIKSNPQFIISAIQKVLHQGKEFNSFEPFNEPGENFKNNGIFYINDIKYGDEYPRSFLDISYPDADTSKDRPTVIYFHGGGFFGGDKAMGDPLAENDDANALFDKIVLDGYNLVSVNYALVPDYRFPIPLLQVNEAINFLVDNAEKYHLNMENVIVMGSSAGAILTSQYGAIISNPEYAESLGIEPKLTTKEVKCVVIDDAPLDVDNFGFKLRVLVGNYLSGTTYIIGTDVAKQYNSILHVNENYPPAFMTSGNVDGFPEDMQLLSDTLTSYGVENENFAISPEDAKTMHGYLNMISIDTNAQACYEQMIAFMNKYTKDSHNN